jgi:hypothetical protein
MGGAMMKGKKYLDWRTFVTAGAIILGFLGGVSIFVKGSAPVYGGMFGQMAQQQAGRFQISACDNKTAWVIDTSVGDVFLMYANGKWKDVGSILDDRTRIKKD